MALPVSLHASTTPQELEFVAGYDMIEIMPSVQTDRIRVLSGTYGPLDALRTTKVPLWMALHLKARKKCRIVSPPWLTVDYLQDRLAEETSEKAFSLLPFRYAEIAKLLLDSAAEDIESADKIRLILKDIHEARQAKSREGLHQINDVNLRVRNICALELNDIRPSFVKSMDILIKLSPQTQQSYEEEDTFRDWSMGDDSYPVAADSTMDTEW
ncbi:DNA replication protein psf2 [Tulasnella sp. UAMH 9824]|nr:DNA replication protein psf2 [Tulasnella sp. UAMH 9824]